MRALEGISKTARVALLIAGAIMFTFFAVQTCVAFGWCNASYEIALFGYLCVIAFMPPFFVVVAEILKAKSHAIKYNKYNKKLTSTLISQTHNELFYSGNLAEGAKTLTQETVETIEADRTSIWLYNEDKTSIVCQQLYIGAENSFYNGIELFERDFGPYFEALKINPIIIANDAESHVATSCFTEGYLRPLGIKSMLDVPIVYRGETIGVLCIESLSKRNWEDLEVEFAQLMASIYSFAYSVAETIEAGIETHTKNTYLEHAAKILRHDMHSGINTYIPRGISSLERRLPKETIEALKLEAPLKMLKEGLAHSQKVYKGVYEFTNLVKKDAVLERTESDLQRILLEYLSSTSYISQVKIDSLRIAPVNQALFCTAVDNLIRNGLKYNDSDSKVIHIYMQDGFMCIQDNGRGMTQEELEYLSKPYTRKEGQKERGTGLGLNICIAILGEHGFNVTAEKNSIGTLMKIDFKGQ